MEILVTRNKKKTCLNPVKYSFRYAMHAYLYTIFYFPIYSHFAHCVRLVINNKQWQGPSHSKVQEYKSMKEKDRLSGLEWLYSLMPYLCTPCVPRLIFIKQCCDKIKSKFCINIQREIKHPQHHFINIMSKGIF